VLSVRETISTRRLESDIESDTKSDIEIYIKEEIPVAWLLAEPRLSDKNRG
jgi:hypothetical protein